nr:MAG TPA: hypothetical protein [Caudoviricetes sp.]
MYLYNSIILGYYAYMTCARVRDWVYRQSRRPYERIDD